MNELALFAGAGGGILGAKLLGWRTVCAVEIDPYCQEILLRRQEEGHLEAFPIWDDIRSFDGKPWCGKVDIVTGGFPCQPHSCAGKRLGEADERGGEIWRHTVRIIKEVGARYCFLENVPGLLTSGMFGTVAGDLAESGYGVKWRCLSAAECGAPHKRDRIWIRCEVADAGKERLPRTQEIRKLERKRSASNGSRENLWWDTDPADVADAEIREPRQQTTRDGREGAVGRGEEVADAEGARQQTCRADGMGKGIRQGRSAHCRGWSAKPRLGRVAHGVPDRVDRLRAIGNAQVPAVVREAWRLLSE